MSSVFSYTYAERLQTFDRYWDEQRTAARQLAAIRHIYDRPPLEVLEEGTRCITCSAFVKRDLSIKALGDNATAIQTYEDAFEDFNFHHPHCTRLQVRLPLEPQALLPGLHGYSMQNLRSRFERKRKVADHTTTLGKLAQTSSLFNLPTEIRLEIYAMILPTLYPTTEVLPLNRDSARVITRAGYDKTGPRDTTKPNLLRTCRAVNEEAMDLLYSYTTFQFQSTKVMYLFLRSIGKHGRLLIKSIDVHCGSREDAIAFALLAACEKLQSITIRLPRPMLLFSRAPIWCVDGMSCLLSLRGLKDVTFASCNSSFNYMDDNKPDAAIIRKELMRPRETEGDIKEIGGLSVT